MKADWLMLRAKALSAGRALAGHWFAVVVLAPMILGGFYFFLSPSVEQAGGWLRRAAPDWTGADLTAAGFLLAAAMVAAGLPSALRHIYAIGQPEAYLDALPVSAGARFRAVLLGQLLRNVPAWIALGLAFRVMAEPASEGGLLPPAATLLAALSIAAVQLLTALLLVHLGWLGPWRLLALGLAVVGACLMVRYEPLFGVAMAPLLAPASFLQAVIAGALEMDMAARGWLADWQGQSVGAAAMVVAAEMAYMAWRDAEVQRAQAALSRNAVSFPSLQSTLSARFGPEIGAQIARDLRLTLRGSTPAVWTCAASAALFLAAMPASIANAWVPPQWQKLLLMALTGAATLSLAALAPVLLQSHAGALWMEHVSGANPETMLKAKKYFALIVSSPVALVVVLTAFLLPETWGAAAYFAARAVLGWVTVASLIGAVAFDVAASPAVGLMLAGLISMAVCGMYGFDEF
ncbi:MAG: hypothetical protein KDE45_19625, partial [Caldilineaceae bacterium]|nr:hypothetical protein [Caldilineaceae bacterium]